MADVTITNGISGLGTVFNQMKEVFYLSESGKALDTIAAFDMELPILEEGVTFNTGDANITKVKLTTGQTWTSMATAGDPDIKFQIASIAGKVNETFMSEVGTNPVAMTAAVGGVTYQGVGYDASPKKVTGALFLRSEDGQTAIYLPCVEGYASLVVEKGKPAYFNTSWAFKADSSGASVYILTKKPA